MLGEISIEMLADIRMIGPGQGTRPYQQEKSQQSQPF
jgi:hypothetical protein